MAPTQAKTEAHTDEQFTYIATIVYIYRLYCIQFVFKALLYARKMENNAVPERVHDRYICM